MLGCCTAVPFSEIGSFPDGSYCAETLLPKVRLFKDALTPDEIARFSLLIVNH